MPTADLQPGRWRCTLCDVPAWRQGTLQDFMQHYFLYHYGKGE